jgi:hypothetical protein
LGAGEADMVGIMAERDDNGCLGIGIITCAVGGIDTVAGARPCTGVTRAKSYRTMAYEDQQSTSL